MYVYRSVDNFLAHTDTGLIYMDYMYQFCTCTISVSACAILSLWTTTATCSTCTGQLPIGINGTYRLIQDLPTWSGHTCTYIWTPIKL